MDSCTIISPPGYHRSWRALIAAKFSGFKLDEKPFVPGKTDTEKSFLANFPPSTVPVLEDKKNSVYLFDANAISYYVGNDQLRGGPKEYLVTQWCNFADNGILPSVATWVYPCLGVSLFNKQNTDKAKANIKSILGFINQYLADVTYLVGERITQADVTLFTALHLLFKHVIDESNRKPYPHVVRWYMTIANQPEVLAVAGTVELCVKEAQFDAKKFAELNPKAQQKPKHQKEPAQKKKEKPKSDEESDNEAPVVPKSNPFDALAKGSFDLDEFKRTYCNNDVESVGIPYFWQHFDPSAYSIWECDYKYPEELGMLFMTSNLVGGMCQRLEKLNKYAFACMAIFGQDKKNTIKGLWIWRGTDFLFDIDKTYRNDCDSYNWQKLDHAAESTKKLVHEYFTLQFSDSTFSKAEIYK